MAFMEDNAPRRRVFAACALVFTLLLPAAPQAQPINFVTCSLAEGLPQSQVFAMCLDARGYLWLGTQGGGLSRFDGQHFETYTVTDGLPSNYIGALTTDADNRLWVGTNRGLCRFDGHRFEPIALSGSNANPEITALATAPDGHVWIGAGRGLFVCAIRAGSARQQWMPGQGAQPLVLAIFPTGNDVWVGTDRGAWCFEKQNLRRVGEKEGLPGTSVFGFARDEPSGRLWMATLGGVAAWDERGHRIAETLRDPALYRSYCLLADAGGRLWIGTTNNGLGLYDPAAPGNHLTLLREPDGLPHEHVRCLLRDHGGQLWIGTSGGGIARLSRQPFRHFDQGDGLAGSRVYALHEDRARRLWVAVSQNGLQMLDSSGFHPFARDSGYLRLKCRTIAEDRAGHLWVGTEGRGIAVFDSTGMHVLDRRAGLPSDLVQKIAPGPGGEMWVATLSGGIARVERDAAGAFRVRAYSMRDGLPDLQIQALQNDPSGKIWFATQAGHVGFFAAGELKNVYGTRHGLPPVPLRTLAFDARGRLWVGSKGAGILWLDPKTKDPHFQNLDTLTRLHSPNIYSLVFDSLGNLWAGSETGVDKLTFSSTGSVLEIRHFGKADGFLGIETCQDAALLDHTGNLWFGTMNGLTRCTPGAEADRPGAPALHFETISLFYKPLSETAYARFSAPGGGLYNNLELPYHQNHLSFAFRAVDLSRPENLRYRWRLDGAEAEWSPLSAQRQVNYANLSPGRYTFLVQATSDGATFSAPLRAEFVVKQPLWALWWFRLAAAVLVLGLGAWAVHSWLRRLRKSEQARREKLEVENRLLQLEQKALQLQMNPHFIFNALTSIQALITEQNYSTARSEINHFAQLMRGILANSRRQSISLQEEIGTLEQYLRIEQFCQGQKFDFQIETPETLNPEEVEIPPMLLQPFVENAVVHGVAPLSYPGHISIRFALEDEVLACEIRDNGIGRERAARLREEKKPGHQSAALLVTQERLEALRAGRLYPPLEITDVLNGQGEIAGTKVVVRIPVVLGF